MDKKLQIAMIAACPFPYPRGTPVRIYRMAEALKEYGHDVHVITYHLGNQSDQAPFKIHRIPDIRSYKQLEPGPTYTKLLLIDLLLSIKVLSVFGKYKFDIIHAHHFEGLIAASPLRIFSRVPIIFDIHTLLETELHHYDLLPTKSMTMWVAKQFDRIIPKYADYIICVSEEIQNKLVRDAKVSPDKISVIPNGVELERFLVASPESNRERRQLIIAYAGNFSPYQRIDLLLKAFTLIQDTNPGIVLEIHSEDDINKIKPLIKEHGLEESVNIFYTPFIDLPQQLARADILLNPKPDGAGIPIKLLNYMAAGKAIVTFPGSAHRIVHQHTGWVVNGNSPSDFAKGISHLVDNENLRTAMGINARNYVKENYIWSTNSELISKIYHQLLDGE